MRQLLILQIASLLIISSCNPNSNNKSSYSLRDTVLKEHLLAIDSITYFDTTDINYKILKAYQKNDTTYLKEVKTNIEKEREYRQRSESMDSCIHQQKVTELGVDEAYRFILTPAFCRSTINITVTKKADNIDLHFIKYQFNYDTAACRIINEYDKKLTSKNWEEITFALEKADIWGLKRDNGIHGLDGSTMKCIGYKKGYSSSYDPDKVNYVVRWEWSTLWEPLELILKFTGNTTHCN